MPDEMHERSRITGIEIDSVTARLAKLLYPDADIRHQPFEESKLADGYFDVAIGNIPFGDYKPFDPRFKGWNFLIHDYFFAAALEKVRPGGLILFITSKGTLDKLDGALREYVSQQADLLGAIRLPNDAFKKNANTEVTTDIVILRKRLPGELPSGPAWKAITEITNSLGETIPVNEYFAAHPEMMLGEMRLGGPDVCASGADPGGQRRPAGRATRPSRCPAPANVFRPQTAPPSIAPNLDQTFPAPEHIKPNAYTLVNDRIGIRDGDHIHILDGLPLPRAQRIRGLIRVRDAVRRCLRAQVEAADEDDIQAARDCNSTRPTTGLSPSMARFPSAPTPPRSGAILTCRCCCPWSITTRRPAAPPKPPSSANAPPAPAEPLPEINNAQDALLVTLGERGRVDLDYLSNLLHRKPSEFLPDLKGTVFLNPQTNRWETEDEYLSGNVRAKLAVAEAAALADEQFQPNVEALKLVQPADLAASEIDARLGSTWIPAEDIRQFARELLGEEGISVSHAPQLGLWVVQGGYGIRYSVANTTEWGTDRRSALELLEDALNLRTPTVYDHDPDTDRDVVNAPATEAARDKQEKIKERFKQWVWQDDERRERLARKYNDEFNNVRLRSFNGDHLRLPGASPAITLHPAPTRGRLAHPANPQLPAGPRRRRRQDLHHGRGGDGVEAPGPGPETPVHRAQPHARPVLLRTPDALSRARTSSWPPRRISRRRSARP